MLLCCMKSVIKNQNKTLSISLKMMFKKVSVHHEKAANRECLMYTSHDFCGLLCIKT